MALPPNPAQCCLSPPFLCYPSSPSSQEALHHPSPKARRINLLSSPLLAPQDTVATRLAILTLGLQTQCPI